MEIRKIPRAKINPAKYNPRKDLKPGDPEYEKLKRSIEEFGYVEPVIWNERTGNIVGGHQRFKILQEQGQEEIACVVVDLDEAREKALNIALNKVSGDWNNEALAELLKDLEDMNFDLSLTGFDLDEIEKLLEEDQVKEDDFDVDEALEEIEVPITKTGDIWLLGKHRLMCGDSTNAEQVAKLMGKEQADINITDPPYNVNYEGSTGMKIKNDSMEDSKFYNFLYDAYSWYGGRDKETVIEDTVDFSKMKRKELLDYVKRLHEEREHTTIIRVDKPQKNDLHPTMKPLKLIEYLLKNSSKTDDIVVDLFGGSGSTLMTCEQMARRCRTMELDEKYADVIVKRFIELTGKENEVYLIRNGKEFTYEEATKSW